MQCQILLCKLQIVALGDKHVPENHILFWWDQLKWHLAKFLVYNLISISFC